METVEILALCPNCGQESPIEISSGERADYKCTKCHSVLIRCAAVSGYVYVLSNPKMQGLLKIGFSTRKVEERAAELSAATGVPAPFEIEAYFCSTNPEDDERHIHAALERQRVTGREFFEIGTMEAIQVMGAICKRSPAYLSPRHRLSLPTNDHKASKMSEPSSPSTRERIMRAWRQRRW